MWCVVGCALFVDGVGVWCVMLVGWLLVVVECCWLLVLMDVVWC